jgi:hypothetical protein
MEKRHKPMSMDELMRAIRPVAKRVNPRKMFFHYCQRSGQGRFTRKLRPKAQIREERRRQRLARKAARK